MSWSGNISEAYHSEQGRNVAVDRNLDSISVVLSTPLLNRLNAINSLFPGQPWSLYQKSSGIRSSDYPFRVVLTDDIIFYMEIYILIFNYNVTISSCFKHPSHTGCLKITK